MNKEIRSLERIRKECEVETVSGPRRENLLAQGCCVVKVS